MVQHVIDAVIVYCYVLEFVSGQILEQITTEESFNTRHFNLKIFISCTKLKRGPHLYRATIGRKVEVG